MTRRKVSSCCQSHYTEEPSELDGVEFIAQCFTCKQPCKVVWVGEDEGRPRSKSQALADALKNPEPQHSEGELREMYRNERRGIQAPQTPATALEIKDGLIYRSGKVIGTALDDKSWYKAEFKEDWKGSDEALQMLRQR